MLAIRDTVTIQMRTWNNRAVFTRGSSPGKKAKPAPLREADLWPTGSLLFLNLYI